MRILDCLLPATNVGKKRNASSQLKLSYGANPHRFVQQLDHSFESLQSGLCRVATKFKALRQNTQFTFPRPFVYLQNQLKRGII